MQKIRENYKLFWLVFVPVLLGGITSLNQNIGMAVYLPLFLLFVISLFFPMKKLGINSRVLALGALVLATIGCSLFFQDEGVTRQEELAVTPSVQTSVESLNENLKDVSYTIISDKKSGPAKRSIDVRLKKKLNKETLNEIAIRLKSSDGRTYTRTFISYYLTNMEVGSGAWATSHYNPNLEVKILGLSLEAEKTSKSKPLDPGKDVIGLWYDERPHVGAKILLYRKNGDYYIDTKYNDGSGSTTKLSEKKIGSSIRLEETKGSSFGEYWLLEGRELKIYDNEGHITTYRAE